MNRLYRFHNGTGPILPDRTRAKLHARGESPRPERRHRNVDPLSEMLDPTERPGRFGRAGRRLPPLPNSPSGPRPDAGGRGDAAAARRRTANPSGPTPGPPSFRGTISGKSTRRGGFAIINRDGATAAFGPACFDSTANPGTSRPIVPVRQRCRDRPRDEQPFRWRGGRGTLRRRFPRTFPLRFCVDADRTSDIGTHQPVRDGGRSTPDV